MSTLGAICAAKTKMNINPSIRPAAQVETSSIATSILPIPIQAKGEERKARKSREKSNAMARQNHEEGHGRLRRRLKNKTDQIGRNRIIMK